MATATITISDTEDGQVLMNADFDPPITEAPTTDAQHLAVLALEAIGKIMSENAKES